MGWSIAVIDNTVKINKEIVKDLIKAQSYDGEILYEEDVDYFFDEETGTIQFDSDAMEHMDWVGDSDFHSVLQEHKVKGVIKFGSLDGDNFGEFWGYSFDGQGGMCKIEGRLVWNIVDASILQEEV